MSPWLPIKVMAALSFSVMPSVSKRPWCYTREPTTAIFKMALSSATTFFKLFLKQYKGDVRYFNAMINIAEFFGQNEILD